MGLFQEYQRLFLHRRWQLSNFFFPLIGSGEIPAPFLAFAVEELKIHRLAISNNNNSCGPEKRKGSLS